MGLAGEGVGGEGTRTVVEEIQIEEDAGVNRNTLTYLFMRHALNFYTILFVIQITPKRFMQIFFAIYLATYSLLIYFYLFLIYFYFLLYFVAILFYMRIVVH